MIANDSILAKKREGKATKKRGNSALYDGFDRYQFYQ